METGTSNLVAEEESYNDVFFDLDAWSFTPSLPSVTLFTVPGMCKHAAQKAFKSTARL